MNQLSVRRIGPKLKLGRILVTPAALNAAQSANVAIFDLLLRHAHGNWGDISESDREQNDLSVDAGLRVLSCYLIAPDQSIWVITEWDRSATTVLLPKEY